MAMTVFITGSSSGIGKAAAIFFAQKGWNVIAAMRNPDLSLSSFDNIVVVKLDLLDLDSIHYAIEKGINFFGRIDVLVNNAGYGAYGVLESFPREEILRQYHTNVIGLIDVTRAILPHLRSKCSGVVINVSSIAGKMAFPLGALYHSTKFAIEGLSESLCYELWEIGCKVKIIEPGIVNTDFSTRSIYFANNPKLKEYQQFIYKLKKNIPCFFNYSISAMEVAEVIYEAATDNKRKFRYLVGYDAINLVKRRAKLNDEDYLSWIASELSL